MGKQLDLNRHTYKGRTPNQRRELGEQILTRLNGGERLWDIAGSLEISEVTARRYRDLALSSRIAPTVDLYREQANDRLDQTQRNIEGQLAIADAIGEEAIRTESVVLLERAAKIRSDAIALQLRLDERRARLNGLDAPVEATVTIRAEDTADAELQRIIADAKAREQEVRNRMEQSSGA